MMESQVETKEKKKGNGFLKFLLFIILIGIGFGIGYFVPKMDFFKKGNNETKEESKSEESNTGEYVKPIAKSDYKLIKEDNQEFELNDKNLRYVAFYYESKEVKNGIVKEVYIEGKEVLKLFHISVDLETTKDKYVEKDINDSKNNIKYLKDAVNNDKYLLYYYRSEYLVGPEGDEWPGYMNSVAVINNNGEVLFNEKYYDSESVTYLLLDSKEEVLDRNTYVSDEDNAAVPDKYAVYAGDGTEDGKFASVEFK